MRPLFSEKFNLTELLFFQAKLPDIIQVQVEESKDGGYWVKILNLEGCFTQAENTEELFVMVNDAVYSYFSIPEKYIPNLPRYFPSEEIRKKLIQAWNKAIPAEFLHKPIPFSQTVGSALWLGIMSFYFPCKRKAMLNALKRLGLEIQEMSKHTKAECLQNGKKTTIPRKNDIKREITDSICKFPLAKDFEEQKILDAFK